MTQVAVLGAGIAGLSSGWLLNQRSIDFQVYEKQAYAGGLARSFDWNGFKCDFAAHRLFTTDENVLHELLKLVPMGRHIRRSKIYLRGHWLRDPLDVLELGTHLSFKEKATVLKTYFFRPRNAPEISFEQFVLRRYGLGLYNYFFKPYTEKLFGIPGDEISVLWARQKVRLANPLDFCVKTQRQNSNISITPFKVVMVRFPIVSMMKFKKMCILIQASVVSKRRATKLRLSNMNGMDKSTENQSKL